MQWLTIAGVVGPVMVSVMPATLGRAGSYLAAAGLAAISVLMVVVAMGSGTWTFEYGALVAALGAIAFWVSPGYLMAHHGPGAGQREPIYYLLLGGFVGSLVALGESWPLIDLWVVIEATTLLSVALIVQRPERKAFEAAWKYLVLASIGGLVALVGILLMQAKWAGSPAPLGIAALFLVVGLSTKAGLVPFHFWLPDAHAEAPAPVSALLSGAELAGVLMILHRALAILSAAGVGSWPDSLLLGLGLLSVTVGVILIPRQSHLKRLFAYSSIEHMGVVAVGISFGGIALLGALLHVFTHGFAKSQAFYMSGSVEGHYGSLALPDIGSLGRMLPWTGTGLAVSVAALAGLPPLAPFWSEWLVVLGGFRQRGQVVPAAILAMLLAFGLMGLWYRLPSLWRGTAPKRARVTVESWAEALPVVVLSLLTVSAGLLVPWLYRWH
jgi:hydrogenase-4 component F